ncbi:MAG: hypothetical protein N3B14_07520 [Thermoleophilia bacterium]|nr:hypothetical protein [Thermoleophilia bacterium]
MAWGWEEYVRCPLCRATNGPGALFCARCGAALRSRAQQSLSRRFSLAGTILGILLLAMLAAAVFILYGLVSSALRPEERAKTYAQRPGTTATVVAHTPSSSAESGETGATASTLPLQLVRPTSVTSSSALEATSTASYGPTNLVDGDLATAWNEGAEGPGIGEWVRFEFSRQWVLARIEIANGYQKDDERYFGNGRVRSLAIEYSTGTTQLVDLLDSKDIQTIIPTRQPVEWFKITIVDVYPGKIWDDTALSEVRIYARSE